jgi:hypothetical protein
VLKNKRLPVFYLLSENPSRIFLQQHASLQWLPDILFKGKFFVAAL